MRSISHVSGVRPRSGAARRGRLAVLVAVAACVTAAPAAADTVVALEPIAPKLTATADVVAWSDFDVSTGAWFLTVRRAGAVERLPVAPRAVPFDVDLGRDGGDHLVAAYSRCDRDPGVFPATGRGCDLYAFDLDTRLERPIPGASTDGASEYLPSIDGTRVAFARVDERRPGAAARLFVRRLGAGRERELPGGLHNTDPRTGPTGLDLRAGRLAFAWDARGPAGRRFPYGASEMRVDTLRGGGGTLVQRSDRSDLDTTSLLPPTLIGHELRYGVSAVTEGDTRESELRAYDLATGRRGRSPVEPRIAAVAATKELTAYAACADSACRVALREGRSLPAADRVLTRSARPTTMSAYRGWIAFSAFDPAIRAYRLMTRSPAGDTDRVDVAPRSVPFDVDLGPGPGGMPVAVYSRCAVEPRRRGTDGLPLAATGRGCDIFRHPVAGGRERAVAGAGRPGVSEFLPAVWGRRIAFVRRVGGGAPELYGATLTGRRITRLVAGPNDGTPRSLDLRGRRVAAVWERRRRARTITEVRLDGRELARAVSRDGHRRLLSAAFDGRYLDWVERDLTRSPPAVAIRLDPVARSRRAFVLPPAALGFVPARPAGAIYGRRDGAGWSLQVTDVLPRQIG